MQSRHYEPRKQAYRTLLKTMERMIVCGSLNCERVEIPYGANSFPGLFVKGQGAGPRPCVVFCNGLDSVKEMIYLSIRDEFAKRGISCLMVDQPGVGEALRLNGLHAVADSERWASAALDYLETRKDVDQRRFGMMGGRLADITLHARPRLKSASSCALPGAPITTGVNCSAGVLPKRAIGRCRTIGTT